MRKLMFTFLLAALFMTDSAIGQSFEKGSTVVNLGIGIGGTSRSVFISGSSAISFTGSFEIGIVEVGDFGVIGVGGLAGFRTRSYSNSSVRYNTFAFGPRGTFHFTIIPVDDLDVYGIVQILARYDNNSLFVNSFYAGVDVAAGGRYYFSDSMAVFAEIGYGLSILTGGISFKFGSK